VQNKERRQQHSADLKQQANQMVTAWSQQKHRRSPEQPSVPVGIPLLLKVDPGSDLDWLISSFGFEIVSEEEDGYVIVASEDEQLAAFLQKIQEFSTGMHGSGSTAKVHKVESQQERMERILSPELRSLWPTLRDQQEFIVDVSIECRGSESYPKRPKRQMAETDESYQERVRAYGLKNPTAELERYKKRNPQKKSAEFFDRKLNRWNEQVRAIEEKWDHLQLKRQDEFERFVRESGGSLVDSWVEGEGRAAGRLPDSLEVRVTLTGAALRDLVLNYPYLFEVALPHETEQPASESQQAKAPTRFTPLSPQADSPVVGIIDSGIQEGHVLLGPAIRDDSSISFVPEQLDVLADGVRPGGHGTRVAGAVVYGEQPPAPGSAQLPYWLRNIRVLDDDCRMSHHLTPQRYLNSLQPTTQGRIYNHSINSSRPCRLKHMSIWAATVDLISYQHDFLFIQSVGNIDRHTGNPQNPGMLEHLQAGRNYPGFLLEPSSRVATPGESLSAMTVGSVAYSATHPHQFAQADGPSSFSRTGPGIWETTKPDIVEYGGDWVHDGAAQPRLHHHSDSCPWLIRSTRFGPGPAYDRDAVGTSFAAPKVARLAARLQHLLPDEPCLLYRALIAQSARWPESAPLAPETLRHYGYGIPDEQRATTNSNSRVTLITSGTNSLIGGEAHIYQVPVPPAMRRPEMEHKVRIDVTLSFAAKPRRTRRNLNRYLSTWLSWNASKAGETFESFRDRVFLNDNGDAESDGDSVLPWTLRDRDDWGQVKGVSRNRSTLQKDWCTVPAHQLPESFCIAVIGHKGWSENEANAAKYALAISFEMVEGDLDIYQMVKIELEELQTQVSAQVRVTV
jgi:hypothetical protein